MADPEDRTRLEGVPPDGRPRRQPPIIDVEAVEVSLDGSRTTTGGSGPGARSLGLRQSLKRILTFLSLVKFSPSKLAIIGIGSACIITAIAAGALWMYLVPEGIDASQRNVPRPEAAVGPDTIEPPVQASPDKDLESRIAAALDAKLAPLGDRMAALERAVRDAAAAARTAGERAEKMAGLIDGPHPYPPAGESREGAEQQNLAQQQDRRSVEDLANRLAALESRQAVLQRKQDGLDRLASAMMTPDKAVRVATVAVALRGRVERNAPFAAELAAARSLGLDEKTVASLEPFAATGIPTRNELFRSLSALMPELRRLSMPPGRDLGYLDRLQASAVRMLNIRPVRDEPGDDPAAVMSRIEFKITQQDIETMVAELDKLPAPAKDIAQGWRAKALARQDALEAARLIAAASLTKLGEPPVRGPSPR